MDMDDSSEGAPAAMESVTLGQIIHNNRDRLIYLSTCSATGPTSSN